MISVVIPAHNESEGIEAVIQELRRHLEEAGISHEFIVVNDASTDRTGEILETLARNVPSLRIVHRQPPGGLGRAIRSGLEHVRGDGVIIAMGDGSDSPSDVVRYAGHLAAGCDCVFGSRFREGSRVTGYPRMKYLLNRAGNHFIQLLYGLPYNDITNAFKGYRTALLRAIGPLTSTQFEITVELPLKVLRVADRVIETPIAWIGRRSDESKLALGRQCARYLHMVMALRRSR